MSQITLESALEIVPATPAVTTTQITVVSIQENFGWDYDPEQPGNAMGPGRPLTVEATVLLDADRRIQRNVIVWEGDEYVAVRGTWTDADLAAKIAQILTA